MPTHRCASRGPSAVRGVTARIHSSSASRARPGATSATGSSVTSKRVHYRPIAIASRSSARSPWGSAARAVTSAGARMPMVRRYTSCRSAGTLALAHRLHRRSMTSAAIPRSSTPCARSVTPGRRRTSSMGPRRATRARRSTRGPAHALAFAASIATIRIAPTRVSTRRARSRRARAVTTRSPMPRPHARTRDTRRCRASTATCRG